MTADDKKKTCRGVHSHGQGQLDQITPIIIDLRAGKQHVSHPSDTVLSLGIITEINVGKNMQCRP